MDSRMNILFLTPRLPYPPAGGDKLCAYHHIRLLAARADHIHLLSLIEREQEQTLAREFENRIPNLTVETVLLPTWRSYVNCLIGLLTTKLPLQVHYYRSSAYANRVTELVDQHSFDACYFHLIRTAQYAERVSCAIKLLSLTDCLTLRYERSAQYVRGKTRLIDGIERARVARYETAVTSKMDVSIVVAAADGDKLRTLGAHGRIEVVNNGVDLDYFFPDDTVTYEPTTISFLGNLHSVPNRDAVRFLVNEIWPLVKLREPEARLQIIGINAPRRIRALHGKEGIIVTGGVDDVRTYLRRSALTVCPVRFGAGVQNKILESLALGVPALTTSIGFEGLGAAEGEGVLVADTPTDFAESILSITASPELRRDLGRKGREFVSRNYSWDKVGEALYSLLKDNRSACQTERETPC